MGSTPLLRDSHREAESATGCRSAAAALLYLLDMAGHRGPRQATTIPAASTASPPTAASGRQGKPAIITCAAALDCDGDAVLVKVDQTGGACHTGDRTCFEAGPLTLGVL